MARLGRCWVCDGTGLQGLSIMMPADYPCTVCEGSGRLGVVMTLRMLLGRL